MLRHVLIRAILLTLGIAAVGAIRIKQIAVIHNQTQSKVQKSLPTILLLGDSITAYGAQWGGWGSRLQTQFGGKAQVINKGVGGKTTTWGHSTANDLVNFDAANTANTSLAVVEVREILKSVDRCEVATVWFGANDAATGGVPLTAYKHNLVEIVNLLHSSCRAVIVLGPPPIDEIAYPVKFQQRRHLKTGRTLAMSIAYSKAAEEAAADAHAPFINVWNLFRHVSINEVKPHLDDWKTTTPSYLCDMAPFSDFAPPVGIEKDPWRGLLCDGLHLSPLGDIFIFNELNTMIQRLTGNRLKISLTSHEKSAQSSARATNTTPTKLHMH
eukprot:gnl/TRDRNA2_/TRDRNA2_40693_c0_seq1.p1 gnl/TRDRNA2_/TRDRNA2_40693_c0~~gnl/TRDRNA2_/TRDRNA2_40693_c0_seq1.p1  ORF type:complete len:342 (-),score=36.29 gnl/TRDRNA2_/TRDRNA2_40693_c0_seq1:51-1031(-)